MVPAVGAHGTWERRGRGRLCSVSRPSRGSEGGVGVVGLTVISEATQAYRMLSTIHVHMKAIGVCASNSHVAEGWVWIGCLYKNGEHDVCMVIGSLC